MSRRKDEDFFVRCVRALKSIDCRDSRTKSGLEVGDGLCFDFFFFLVSSFWQVVTCGFVGFSTRLDPDRPPCWRAEYVRFAYDAGCHVTSTLYIGRLTEAQALSPTSSMTSSRACSSCGPFLPSECQATIVLHNAK